MKIANSKKFENTVLAERLSASETDIEKRKQACWQTLCQLYNINPTKLVATKTNAWATLCQALVEDVFPGFNQTKKVGRKPIRNEGDSRLIYEMYFIAKKLSRWKKDFLYYELADFESKRTGKTVTPEMIHNIVNKGKNLNLKNLRNQKSLGEMFTEASTEAEAYDAQDVVLFLSSLANLPRKTSLPIADDPRNKAIYAKPIGKRRKQD